MRRAPRRKAIPFRQSWPAIACGRRSSLAERASRRARCGECAAEPGTRDSVPVTSTDLTALRAGAAPQPPADSLVALALGNPSPARCSPGGSRRRHALDSSRASRCPARLHPDAALRLPTAGVQLQLSGLLLRLRRPAPFRCGLGANRTGWPMPRRADSTGPRPGCATRSSSSVRRSLKPLPESKRHNSAWRSSWTACCPTRGGQSNRCCGAIRSVAPNS